MSSLVTLTSTGERFHLLQAEWMPTLQSHPVTPLQALWHQRTGELARMGMDIFILQDEFQGSWMEAIDPPQRSNRHNVLLQSPQCILLHHWLCQSDLDVWTYIGQKNIIEALIATHLNYVAEVIKKENTDDNKKKPMLESLICTAAASYLDTPIGATTIDKELRAAVAELPMAFMIFVFAYFGVGSPIVIFAAFISLAKVLLIRPIQERILPRLKDFLTRYKCYPGQNSWDKYLLSASVAFTNYRILHDLLHCSLYIPAAADFYASEITGMMMCTVACLTLATWGHYRFDPKILIALMCVFNS